MTDTEPTVADHRARVLGLIEPLAPRPVPAADALGLALANDVVAALAVPRFDHSAMDGYAVHAADVAGASETTPVTLPVLGAVAAGDAWPDTLAPGMAVRIMTGAPVPDGADAVVPFEWTDRGHETVEIRQAVAANRHIRRAGEDVATGDVALAAGTVVAARHLGLLASVGCAEVVVRQPRPRVAVIATGEELVAAAAALTKPSSGDAVGSGAGSTVRDQDLPAGAVPESNSVTLAAAARALGAASVVVGPAPDRPAAFLEVLDRALAGADLVVTTGGVSAGDHDVVKAALRGRDGMWFGKVAVKPGRPQGCGALTAPDGRRVPVVSLPGTPVAAYSSFLLFVAPAIRLLAGRHPWPGETAVLATSLRSSADRAVVLPGRYVADGEVSSMPGHAGHSQRMLADADVVMVLPPAAEQLEAGTVVDVVRLDPEV